MEVASMAGERYWNMGEEEEGEMMMKLIGEDKRLSDMILKKMVEERRRKQQLQDDLADVAKEIAIVVQQIEEYAPTLEINRINNYLTRIKDY
jgi:acetate kinase